MSFEIVRFTLIVSSGVLKIEALARFVVLAVTFGIALQIKSQQLKTQLLQPLL